MSLILLVEHDVCHVIRILVKRVLWVFARFLRLNIEKTVSSRLKSEGAYALQSDQVPDFDKIHISSLLSAFPKIQLREIGHYRFDLFNFPYRLRPFRLRHHNCFL